MKIRNTTSRIGPDITKTQDWTFGHGTQDYVTGNAGVALAIEQALKCFYGDCFWHKNFGVDWWTLLSSKGTEATKATILAQCREVILSVKGVVACKEISVSIAARGLSIRYVVQSDYSNTTITNTTAIYV